MAQTISIAGASYPDVPSIQVPKTGGGTAVFYDASIATATADKILSGYTAFGATGLITGTAAGVEGYGYTLTPIAAQQSVTTGSNRQGVLSNPLGAIEDGKHYVVTYDGTTYLTTCHVLWTNNYVIGDYAWATGTESDYVYPFAIVGYQSNIILCSMTASSTHTVKIDRIDLYGAVNSCYLGTGTPSSSLGVDGDIYIST